MVKYTLANALRSHTIPAVVTAIRGLGIIGVDKYGIKGSKDKDPAVIEHALSLVIKYMEVVEEWFNRYEEVEDYPERPGPDPSEFFELNYHSYYHTMGWEEEPDFIDTNPSLAKTDTRQYRKQQILIAALCQKHGDIDHQAPGAAAKVREYVEKIGEKMDEGTILKYLRQIPAALGKSQSE